MAILNIILVFKNTIVYIALVLQYKFSTRKDYYLLVNTYFNVK